MVYSLAEKYARVQEKCSKCGKIFFAFAEKEQQGSAYWQVRNKLRKDLQVHLATHKKV